MQLSGLDAKKPLYILFCADSLIGLRSSFPNSQLNYPRFSVLTTSHGIAENDEMMHELLLKARSVLTGLPYCCKM
jgi:hypothetical protein